MQKYIELKNKKNKFKIRIAKKEDLFFTLRLFNQNILDKKFFSKKKITLKEHKIWFFNVIQKKKFFICLKKEKVGYVRYEEINKRTLSVSIAIREKFKRKGYGKHMLLSTLKRKKISKYNVIAVVKNTNLASKRFFLDCGFKFYKNNIYMLKSK